MHGEIPVFRRCCCCLPLRYGLLAWGYFKMIADAFLLCMLSYSLIETIQLIQLYGVNQYSRMYSDLVIISCLTILFFADLIVTIVFIVGAHKKNVKLIRVFYILSMVMWALSFVMSVIGTVRTMMSLIQYEMYYHWEVFLTQSSFYFIVLAIQSYFILLLRSEIIKLGNSGEFRFVNNAAESECTMTTMTYEEKVAAEEAVKEVVTK